MRITAKPHKDYFRKYHTPEECFTDHVNFFFKNARYKKALEVKHGAYKFADAIAAARYAADPNHAGTLKQLVKMVEGCIA